MCIQPADKTMLFFDEYMKGFNELQTIVNSFEGVNNGSRQIFLDSRYKMLQLQKEAIEGLRDEIIDRAKKFLANINSELFAVTETMAYITQQLDECIRFRQNVIGFQEEKEVGAP